MRIISRDKARKISFRHGGKHAGSLVGKAVPSAVLADTDPNDPPQKSIRVLGSAPLLGQGQLPWSIDKYRSLLTENQEKDLREFSDSELEVATEDFDVAFSDKLRDFGLDPDNIRDQTFINEFNRTKSGFEKNFPGGVRFEAAHGPDELRKGLADLGENEEVALLDHFSSAMIFGTQVGNLGNINQPLIRSELSQILNDTVGSRNCYLGICHGENTEIAVCYIKNIIRRFKLPDGVL